jgi:aldehyde dehydrogenase (NAD+)
MSDFPSIKSQVASQSNHGRLKGDLSLEERLVILRKWLHLLETHEEALMQALQMDLGKSPMAAYTTEIGMLKAEIRHFIKKLPSWTKPQKVHLPWIHFPASGYRVPQSIGQVLVISPWNYPLLLAVQPAISAIAAGCRVVLKPSEHAPATSAMLVTLAEAFSPNDILVFTGNQEVAQALLLHPFNHVFFTGSSRVGMEVYQAAAKIGASVTLELGGKNPCFVHRPKSMEVAVRRILWGKTLNTGQTCLAPDHVIISQKEWPAFLTEWEKQVTSMYGERPLESVEWGRIIHRGHYDRLKQYILENEVLNGGEFQDETLKIGPTLLRFKHPHAAFGPEEIFGPILPVIFCDDPFQWMQTDGNRPGSEPLAGYVFSEDRVFLEAFSRTFRSGGGAWNDTIMQVVGHQLPFGGLGRSGLGQYHGKAGFDTFTHYKSELRKHPTIDIPSRYPPFGPKALARMKKLMDWFL